MQGSRSNSLPVSRKKILVLEANQGLGGNIHNLIASQTDLLHEILRQDPDPVRSRLEPPTPTISTDEIAYGEPVPAYSSSSSHATTNQGLIDTGWKDIALVCPGERARIAIKFEPYPGRAYSSLSKSSIQRYNYNAHIHIMDSGM